MKNIVIAQAQSSNLFQTSSLFYLWHAHIESLSVPYSLSKTNPCPMRKTRLFFPYEANIFLPFPPPKCSISQVNRSPTHKNVVWLFVQYNSHTVILYLFISQSWAFHYQIAPQIRHQHPRIYYSVHAQSIFFLVHIIKGSNHPGFHFQPQLSCCMRGK